MIRTILESEHDSKLAGHFSQEKTIELLRRNFWWPGMDTDITEYVQACPGCKRDTSRRHRRYGLLSPLGLPYAPRQSMGMDFIPELPQSNGCTELWVVLDRFSKMAHFIPLEKDKKTAEDLARIFARDLWRLHGLPRDIVSNRDSRFTSNTWKDLLAVIGIRPHMSTTFQPQTDRQTERVNLVIEAYLWPVLNQEQEDWEDLLPMAQHAYFNSITSATGMTPLFANYGRHSESQNPQRMEVMNPASHAYAHWIAGALDRGKKAPVAAWERMTKYADARRTPLPVYKVGDVVMLSTTHLKLKRPSRKLDHKFIGPFQN